MPEISGSPWCPSFEDDNLVLLKWEREGHRHQGTHRSLCNPIHRYGLQDDKLRWPCHYGNNVSMLLRQEGREKQDPPETGLNQLIKMVLTMVWSLNMHCNTKSHSPLTMVGAVIVRRLIIEG